MLALALFALLMSVNCNEVVRVVKPYKVAVPVLLPLTGDGIRQAGGCKIGATIAADMFNGQPQLLRDFTVELVFYDEGPVGMRALAQLMTFQRSQLANGTMKAPMVVGPFFTPGCKPVASVAKFIKVVETGIGCGTPAMTARRDKYPNFYRARVGGDVQLYAILQYVKNVAKWKRIAILTWAGNVFNYGIAKLMYAEATRRGIQVAFFEIASDVDEEAIRRLKDSKIRIIAFQVAETNFIIRFLCLTYKLGLTGPRYVFFLFNYGFVRLRDLPFEIGEVEGCTRDHIAAQLPQAKFTGAQSHLLVTNFSSSLGHTYHQFLREYQTREGNRFLWDASLRELCYDATARSLLTMATADKILNQRNSSLRDYENNPDEVTKVVNQSTASIDYTGFQYGRSRYSERLELDDHPHVLFSWKEETDSANFEYSVQLSPGGDPYNADDYMSAPINPVKWRTSDGMPPVESYKEQLITVDISSEGFIAVLVLAAALGTCQIGLLVWANIRNRRCTGELEILLVACLVCNVGAVLHAVKTSHHPSVLCVTRPIMTAIGMAFLETFFWLRLSAIGIRKMLPNQMQQQRIVRFRRRNQVAGAVPSTSVELPTTVEMKGPARIKTVAGCFFPSVTLLVIWMLVHPVGVTIDHPDEAFYDEEMDTMYEEQFFICSSKVYAGWAMGIAGWNLVVITGAAFKVYKLRKVPDINAVRSYKAIRLGILNLEVVLIASMLVLVTLESPISQQIALSTILLLISALSAVVVFYFEFAQPLENQTRAVRNTERTTTSNEQHL